MGYRTILEGKTELHTAVNKDAVVTVNEKAEAEIYRAEGLVDSGVKLLNDAGNQFMGVAGNAMSFSISNLGVMDFFTNFVDVKKNGFELSRADEDVKKADRKVYQMVDDSSKEYYSTYSRGTEAQKSTVKTFRKGSLTAISARKVTQKIKNLKVKGGEYTITLEDLSTISGKTYEEGAVVGAVTESRVSGAEVAETAKEAGVTMEEAVDQLAKKAMNEERVASIRKHNYDVFDYENVNNYIAYLAKDKRFRSAEEGRRYLEKTMQTAVTEQNIGLLMFENLMEIMTVSGLKLEGKTWEIFNQFSKMMEKRNARMADMNGWEGKTGREEYEAAWSALKAEFKDVDGAVALVTKKLMEMASKTAKSGKYEDMSIDELRTMIGEILALSGVTKKEDIEAVMKNFNPTNKQLTNLNTEIVEQGFVKQLQLEEAKVIFGQGTIREQNKLVKKALEDTGSMESRLMSVLEGLKIKSNSSTQEVIKRMLAGLKDYQNWNESKHIYDQLENAAKEILQNMEAVGMEQAEFEAAKKAIEGSVGDLLYGKKDKVTKSVSPQAEGILEAVKEKKADILKKISLSKIKRELASLEKDLLDPEKSDKIETTQARMEELRTIKGEWEKAESAYRAELMAQARLYDEERHTAVYTELFGPDGIGSYDKEAAAIGEKEVLKTPGLITGMLISKDGQKGLLQTRAEEIREANKELAKTGKGITLETKLELIALYDLSMSIAEGYHLFANQMAAGIKQAENGALLTDMGGGKSKIGGLTGFLYNMAGLGPIRIICPTENLAIRDADANIATFAYIGFNASSVQETDKDNTEILKQKMLGENNVHYISSGMPGFMKMGSQTDTKSDGLHIADGTFATVVDEGDTLMEIIARSEKEITANEAKELNPNSLEYQMVKHAAELARMLKEKTGVGYMETKVAGKAEESQIKTDETKEGAYAYKYDKGLKQVVGGLSKLGSEIVNSEWDKVSAEIRANLEAKKMNSGVISRILREEKEKFEKRVLNAIQALHSIETNYIMWAEGSFVLKNDINNQSQRGMRSQEVASYQEYFSRQIQEEALADLSKLEKLHLDEIRKQGVIPGDANLKTKVDGKMIQFFAMNRNLSSNIDKWIEAQKKENGKAVISGKEINSVYDLEGMQIKEIMPLLIAKIKICGESLTSNDTDVITAIRRQSSAIGFMSGTMPEYEGLLKKLGWTADNGKKNLAKLSSWTSSKATRRFSVIREEQRNQYLMKQLTEQLKTREGFPLAINFDDDTAMNSFLEYINNKESDNTEKSEFKELMAANGYSFEIHNGKLDSGEINAVLNRSGHRKILLSTLFGRGDEIKLAMYAATSGMYTGAIKKQMSGIGLGAEAEELVKTFKSGNKIDQLVGNEYQNRELREKNLLEVKMAFDAIQKKIMTRAKDQEYMRGVEFEAIMDYRNVGMRDLFLKLTQTSDMKKLEEAIKGLNAEQKTLLSRFLNETKLGDSVKTEDVSIARAMEKYLDANRSILTREMLRDLKQAHDFTQIRDKAWTRINRGVYFLSNFRQSTVELYQAMGRVARLTDPGEVDTYLTDKMAYGLWEKAFSMKRNGTKETQKLIVEGKKLFDAKKRLEGEKANAKEAGEKARIEIEIREADRRIVEITMQALDQIKQFGLHRLKESIELNEKTELIQDKWLEYRKEFMSALTGKEVSAEMKTKVEGIIKGVVSGLVNKIAYSGKKQGGADDFKRLGTALSKLFDGMDISFKAEELKALSAEQLTEKIWSVLGEKLEAVAGNERETLLQRLFFDIEGDEIIKQKGQMIENARTADLNKQSNLPLMGMLRAKRFAANTKDAMKRLEKEIAKRTESEYIVNTLVERAEKEVVEEEIGEVMVADDLSRNLSGRFADEMEKSREKVMAEKKLLEEKMKKQALLQKLRSRFEKKLKEGDVYDSVVMGETKAAETAEEKQEQIEKESGKTRTTQATAIVMTMKAQKVEKTEVESVTFGEKTTVETIDIRGSEKPEETAAGVEVRGAKASKGRDGIIRVDSVNSVDKVFEQLMNSNAGKLGLGKENVTIISEYQEDTMSADQRRGFYAAVKEIKASGKGLPEGMQQVVVVDKLGNVKAKITYETGMEAWNMNGAVLSKEQGFEKVKSGYVVWNRENGVIQASIRSNTSIFAVYQIEKALASGASVKVNTKGGVMVGNYSKVANFENFRGIAINSVITETANASQIQGEVINSIVNAQISIGRSETVRNGKINEAADLKKEDIAALNSENRIVVTANTEIERLKHKKEKGWLGQTADKVKALWNGMVSSQGITGKVMKTVDTVLFFLPRQIMKGWNNLWKPALNELDKNPNLEELKGYSSYPAEFIATPKRSSGLLQRLWPFSDYYAVGREITKKTEEAKEAYGNGDLKKAFDLAKEAVKMDVTSKDVADAMLIAAISRFGMNKDQKTSSMTEAETKQNQSRITSDKEMMETFVKRYFDVTGESHASAEALFLRGMIDNSIEDLASASKKNPDLFEADLKRIQLGGESKEVLLSLADGIPWNKLSVDQFEILAGLYSKNQEETRLFQLCNLAYEDNEENAANVSTIEAYLNPVMDRLQDKILSGIEQYKELTKALKDATLNQTDRADLTQQLNSLESELNSDLEWMESGKNVSRVQSMQMAISKALKGIDQSVLFAGLKRYSESALKEVSSSIHAEHAESSADLGKFNQAETESSAIENYSSLDKEMKKKLSGELKWLAVMAGAMRIMSAQIKSVGDCTPEMLPRNLKRIKDLMEKYPLESKMNADLNKFQLILKGFPALDFDLAKFQDSLFDNVSVLDSQVRGIQTSRVIRNNSVIMELDRPVNNQTVYEFNFDASGRDYKYSEQFTSMLNVYVEYLKIHKTDKGIKIYASKNNLLKVLGDMGLSKYSVVLPVIDEEKKSKIDQKNKTNSIDKAA